MGSDFNGIEITQILKGRFDQAIPEYAQGITAPNTKIIFVTAYSARYGKKKLIEAGGDDDLMTKPVDFTRLSLVMSRMMAQAPTATHPVKTHRLSVVKLLGRPANGLSKWTVRLNWLSRHSRGDIQYFAGRCPSYAQGTQPDHPSQVRSQRAAELYDALGQAGRECENYRVERGNLRPTISLRVYSTSLKELLENWLKQSNPSDVRS